MATTQDIAGLPDVLDRLIERVGAGEEFILTQAGRSVARIIPEPPAVSPRQRMIGSLKGQLHVPDDFDQTPADLLREFEEGDLADFQNLGPRP